MLSWVMEADTKGLNVSPEAAIAERLAPCSKIANRVESKKKSRSNWFNIIISDCGLSNKPNRYDNQIKAENASQLMGTLCFFEAGYQLIQNYPFALSFPPLRE